MNLDFAVIGTNVIGFVIVVLVLRKFAWGPILGMLDARREKIGTDFAEAETARGDAERIRTDLEAQLVDIKVIERERVQEAVKKGEEIADRLTTEAKTKATATLEKAEHDIGVESQKAQMQLRDQVVDLAIRSSEKLIRTKLDDETHRKLIRDYIDGLEGVGDA